MPLFDFKCPECGYVMKDQYRNKSEMENCCFPHCDKCGTVTEVMFNTITSNCVNFEAQWIRDISNRPVFVRNKSELNDAIAKFNDTELASKQGRVHVYEPKLTRREV
jgi:NAD-dependent SIR2 family protein deacetylase